MTFNIMNTLKYGQSLNTGTDVPATCKILQPFCSLDFKNRYVSANINMESGKIIANISLKLICGVGSGALPPKSAPAFSVLSHEKHTGRFIMF